MQVNATGIRSFPATAALGPYLRVKRDATDGLAVCGEEDVELGTLKDRHVVSGLGAAAQAPVVVPTAQGTVKMVAAGAITIYDDVYGAAAGKVSATANGNYIGIALTVTTADGDYVEVLRLARSPNAGVPGLVIEDDFIGDYPAAGTALTGNDWTKVETLGLGVTSVDGANGILKFAFDAVAEAATAVLYMANSPLDITKDPIVEFRLAIFDIGDDAALDINFGLANDTHATDADVITDSIFFHLDGADLSLKCECDDGTNETAATDTTVDLVDDVFYDFKIDATTLADVKFYYRAIGAPAWTRLLSSTTFSVAASTAIVTPIIHMEKTANDTTADVRLDWLRGTAARA